MSAKIEALLSGVAGAAFAAVLASCTTGQTNVTPPIRPPAGGGAPTGVLALAVGTANFEGAPGLVVLETFRGANGYTAVPITTARLRAPAAFAAPKGSKDPGSGTHGGVPIGSNANAFVIGGGLAPPTTRLAGADGWGVGPPSCSCPGVNFYPFQPQFADVATPFLFPGGPEPIYGGPPAYPPTTLDASALSSLVSIPSGWSEGFYLIALTSPPPGGTYALDVSYLQNGVAKLRSAQAVLHGGTLPAFAPGQPSIRSDGKGGVLVSLRLPPHVRQAFVNVIDANVPPAPPPAGQKACPTGLGFATLLFTASGTKRIPDDLGNYGQGGAPTFCKKDLLDAQAFGFDYDDFDLGPPRNSQQRPVLPERADMTIGAQSIGVE